MDKNSLTLAKFRSAWITPAVAQAPTVTRERDALRTFRIRSASCFVVIDPSTSDRSYGPLMTVLEASRKYAISIWFANVSSSSSQERTLSWHPSQDANFH